MNSSQVVVCVALLTLAGCREAEPKSYAECVLRHLPEAKTQYATQVMEYACREAHPFTAKEVAAQATINAAQAAADRAAVDAAAQAADAAAAAASAGVPVGAADGALDAADSAEAAARAAEAR